MKKHKQVVRILEETGLNPSFLRTIPTELAVEIMKKHRRTVLSTLHSDRVADSKIKKINLELSDKFDQLERIGYGLVHTACIFEGKKDKQEHEEEIPKELITEEQITRFVLGDYFNNLSFQTVGKLLAVTNPTSLFRNNNYLTIDYLFDDKRFLFAVESHNKDISDERIGKINELIEEKKEKISTSRKRIEFYGERVNYFRNLEDRIKDISLDERKKLFLNEYLAVREEILEKNPDSRKLLELYEWLGSHEKEDKDKKGIYKYLRELVEAGKITFSIGTEAEAKKTYRSYANERLLSSLPKDLVDKLTDARILSQNILSNISLVQKNARLSQKLPNQYDNINIKYKKITDEINEINGQRGSEVKSLLLARLNTKKQNSYRMLEIAKQNRNRKNIRNYLGRYESAENNIKIIEKLSASEVKLGIIKKLKKRKEGYEISIKRVRGRIEKVEREREYLKRYSPLLLSRITKVYNRKTEIDNKKIDALNYAIKKNENSIDDLNRHKNPSLFITQNSSPKKVLEKYLGLLDDKGKVYSLLRDSKKEGFEPLTIIRFEPDMTISFHNVKDAFYQFSQEMEFSKTARKFMGFIDAGPIYKYISEIQRGGMNLLESGQRSKGIKHEDVIINPEIIMESGAWRTLNTVPANHQYMLSVEDLNGQNVYRIEGRAVTELYSEIKNPVPIEKLGNIKKN